LTIGIASMTKSGHEPASRRLTNAVPLGAVLAPDFSRVLVVGRSPVNRVVVSKIIEKSGLKPISETPEAAAKMLRSVFPGTVILDGGADNRDCESLMARLASLRSECRHYAPSVILLATKSHCEADPAPLAAVDAVVAKPITTELLQPVVDRLLERARQ
jgi:CheY-like chemotaxis protein